MSVTVSRMWWIPPSSICPDIPFPLTQVDGDGSRPLSRQAGPIQSGLQNDRNRVPKTLRRMARPLCVRGQSPDLLRARRTDDVELDDHLLEVGGSVIHVVLLRVAERRADVSAGVVDRDPVQR